MKRTLAVLCLLLLLLFTAAPIAEKASAEGDEFIEIDRDEVCLYENTKRSSPLFVIPRTFYVRIVERNYTQDEHLVEYNGVIGLIKINAVSGKVLKDVENPYYTSKQITAHVDAILYTSPNFNAKTDIEAAGLALTFLGKTQGDQGSYGTSVWFAVLYTDRVYYIHSAKTTNLDLLESSFAPIHPNSVPAAAEVTEPPEGKDTTDKESEGGSFDIVRILLILGMIVPVIIILFVIFRPRRRRSRVTHSSDDRRYYRDEDDYYDDY